MAERDQTSTSSETAPGERRLPRADRRHRLTRPRWLEARHDDLVRGLSEFAADTGRADLAKRLEQTRARLLDPDVRVIVVGEFKQGKSKLINALVNAPACPVDDDIATSVPTSVGYADEPSAWIVTQNEDAAQTPGTAVERRQVLPRGAVRVRVGARQPRQRAPHRLGRGAAAPGDPQGRTASSSTRPASEDSTPPMRWRRSRRCRPPTPCCSCRTPRRSTPSPRCSSSSTRCASRPTSPRCSPRPTSTRSGARSSRSIAGTCSDVGDVPIFSVSSDLRLLAAELQDRALNDESGFPALVAHLRREVLGRAELHPRAQRRARPRLGRRAAHDLAAVRAQRAPESRRHPAHDRPARGGEGARRRVPRALRALAGDPHRRHRRPHRRHGARPARPPAQGAARGGDLDRRGRPRADLGSDHRVARPAGGGGGVGDLRLDRRALTLAVRRGRRAVQRGRVRASRRSTSETPRACSTRSSRSPGSTPGASARGRRSTSACAARTAACSWWDLPPA